MVTLQERAESSTVAEGQQGHSHCIPAGQDQCDVLSKHRLGFSHTGNHPVLAIASAGSHRELWGVLVLPVEVGTRCSPGLWSLRQFDADPRWPEGF